MMDLLDYSLAAFNPPSDSLSSYADVFDRVKVDLSAEEDLDDEDDDSDHLEFKQTQQQLLMHSITGNTVCISYSLLYFQFHPTPSRSCIAPGTMIGPYLLFVGPTKLFLLTVSMNGKITSIFRPFAIPYLSDKNYKYKRITDICRRYTLAVTRTIATSGLLVIFVCFCLSFTVKNRLLQYPNASQLRAVHRVCQLTRRSPYRIIRNVLLERTHEGQRQKKRVNDTARGR